MKNKKLIQFYRQYIIAYFIVVIGVVVYLFATNGEVTMNMIGDLLFVPTIFLVLFLGLHYVITNWMSKRRKEKDLSEYDLFLQSVSKSLKEEELTIEEFRKLRENDKFQRTLKQIYSIHEKGERPEEGITIERLSKKFDKKSIERKGVQKAMIVLQESQKKVQD